MSTRFKDHSYLVGKKYGSKTVLRVLEERDKHGAVQVECKCTCGEKSITTAYYARQGRKCITCGSKERALKRRLRPFEYKYNRLVRENKDRQIVDITYEEYLTFTGKECHYCNAELNWDEYTDKYKGNNCYAYNLDRKDSNKHYTKDNCVPCCYRCNKGKFNNFSYEEWVIMTNALKHYEQI